MYIIINLGIFYVAYGVLGLFGVQVIPHKYQNKRWSRQYKRSRGIGWLLIGIPWCILYFVMTFAAKKANIKTGITCLLLMICSLPGLIYDLINDRKYNAMLK